MKLLRVGERGSERPAVLDGGGIVSDLRKHQRKGSAHDGQWSRGGA
jgi:hypothetical protein